MLLLLSTSNSQAGTDTWENTLCYPDRFHPDADVLPVEQHIHETGGLTCMVFENVNHTWALWTRVNEDAKIAAVKRYKQRCSFELTTELELTQPKILKVFHIDHWHPYRHSHRANLLSIPFVFLMKSSSFKYVCFMPFKR